MTPAQCPTNLIELQMSLEQAIAEGGLHHSLVKGAATNARRFIGGRVN